MLRGFKYRCYPNKEQEVLLRKTLGCSRYVYNKALEFKESLYKKEKKNISCDNLVKKLTLWKKNENQFLNEVSSVPLQQSLRHLDTAYQRFSKRISRKPQYKKKKNGGSVSFTKNSFSIKNGYLFLARMMEKPLKVKWSRKLPKDCKISSVTVSLDTTNQWHVSFLVKDENIKSLPKSPNVIGVDLGLNDYITLSNGEKVKNPKHEKKLRVKLKKLQRKLSKKKKESKNKEKARLKLAKLHKRVSNSRKDFLHKLSTRLINENQVIVVEDLGVKNMMKNHKLARAIADASWRTFLTYLEYKAEWYGREVKKVGRFFPSSKKCSNCGFLFEGKLELSIREWKCKRCNVQHDRDINAAKNILAEGHSVSKKPVEKELHKTLCSIPKGSEIRRSKTQEPTVLRN